MAFRNSQCKAFAKAARERAGGGWELLGPHLQEALVAREIVGVLLQQELPAYEPIQQMIRDTLAAAGFRPGGEK